MIAHILNATVLRGRRSRRVAVALVLAITSLLGSLLPRSFHGYALLVVLLLMGLDIVLIRSTAGLAFRHSRHLDERERSLRDMAYRRGFRLLGLALVLEFVVVYATGVVSIIIAPEQSFRGPGVDNGITGRALVALLEALVILPTMVVAWVAPDDAGDETGAPPRGGVFGWLTLPAAALGCVVLVILGPEQGVGASTSGSSSFSVMGASCAPFIAGRIVGGQVGATVGMRVGVCWNGRDAFVFGDPSIPLPRSAIEGMTPPGVDSGVPVDAMNPTQPDITACGADNLEDFATVSGTTCRAWIDGQGTLHYRVDARVIGPFGLGQRAVQLNLVVDRTGRVIGRP